MRVWGPTDLSTHAQRACLTALPEPNYHKMSEEMSSSAELGSELLFCAPTDMLRAVEEVYRVHQREVSGM